MKAKCKTGKKKKLFSFSGEREHNPTVCAIGEPLPVCARKRESRTKGKASGKRTNLAFSGKIKERASTLCERLSLFFLLLLCVFVPTACAPGANQLLL